MAYDFDDVHKAALDFAKTGPGSEAIEFRAVDVAGDGTWATVQATVNEGDDDNPDLIGTRGRLSNLPIRVVLYKSDGILSITEGRDQIRRGGIKYVIQSVLNEDAGSFYVYAKP